MTENYGDTEGKRLGDKVWSTLTGSPQLYKIIGIADGRSMIMHSLKDPCPSCGQIKEVHLLERSPLFQNEIHPFDEFSPSDADREAIRLEEVGEDGAWPDNENPNDQMARTRLWALDLLLRAISADLHDETTFFDLMDDATSAPPPLAPFDLLIEVAQLFESLHDLIEEECLNALAGEIIEHQRGHLLADLSGVNDILEMVEDFEEPEAA